MFTVEDREPDEYTRLVYLLAINEQVLNDFTEQYDSGTDAPAARTIESRLLPNGQSLVPQSALAEYRASLVRFGEQIRADLQQYKRVRVPTHELSARSKAEQTPKKKARRPGKKASDRSTDG